MAKLLGNPGKASGSYMMARLRLANCLCSVVLAISVISSRTAVAQDSGDDCLSIWTGPIYQNGLPLEETAEILGCRQLLNGSWTTAVIGDTRSFRRAVPIPQELSQLVRDQRNEILDQIVEMVTDPRLSQHFTYDISTGRVTYPGTHGRTEEMSILGQPMSSTPEFSLFGSVHEGYELAQISYLLEPSHEQLADYVEWYMQRRDAALLGVMQGQVSIVRDSMLRANGYLRVPWPWQLSDPFTVDTYALWLSETGRQPTGESSESTSEAGTKRLAIFILSEIGVGISSACVRVSWPGDYLEVCDDEAGDIRADAGSIVVLLPVGTYKVKLERVPKGFGVENDTQTVTVDSDGASVIFRLKENEDQSVLRLVA